LMPGVAQESSSSPGLPEVLESVLPDVNAQKASTRKPSQIGRGKAKAKPAKRLYSFQIDEADLEDLKIRADEDGRTVSGVLRMLVKAYLKE
ncbi:hypothetical protein Q4595_23495, partial [Wenyingzhuangia sp. 1_MG-2023]|nr:hypothetical protein [Wenyingzhuangia sp. 1_MG-2023]